VLIGVVVDAIGVCGEVVESMLKRSVGVLDAGWILPGLGGLLDRVDALLLTGPALWLYVMAIRPLLP
jgi:phosphatidate cytidylyltransferase